MGNRCWFGCVSVVATLASWGAPGFGAVLRVPSEHPTIQDAVDAASAGDVIRVSRGRYCGAVVDERVSLVGSGHPTIVGCEGGPALPGGLRIGFLLPGSAGESPASGARIEGFTFDGEGVSNDDLEPLAFGILARFANGVHVLRNRFVGTTQAITDTAGDDWVIAQNSIEGLTLFDCTGFCSGGDGIVLQAARAPLAVAGGAAEPANRPENNLVYWNEIAGAVPDGFDVFSMVGILNLAADGSRIVGNRIAIPDNPGAAAAGQGIVVTNTCCGISTPLVPGSRDAFVVWNDGKRSEIAVVVEGEGGANTEGLVLARNRGVVVVEGVEEERGTRTRVTHRGPRHPFF